VEAFGCPRVPVAIARVRRRHGFTGAVGLGEVDQFVVCGAKDVVMYEAAIKTSGQKSTQSNSLS
jgi:hypothetical protein